ncbi:PREDICTED: nuclear pore complex protein NUP1-like isoform X2 [Tarenaya hassleriana]|uniref:nuclear pore complex protein NUP1-like isoform X2 n=1 Tax=Tarenaya hassleriana TaxID=28532 RepID=UPI00053C87BE|nr:PREDICTED: nuclear pore complex protein NUP1-like isoform X2 [Tarenaya hassleriana]
MASSARGENSNPYDGGLGAGGKFRKRPFRRSQTTPYDRPPTSVRIPGLGGGEGSENGNGGGWISKLMDPAQRLITYSAHRLFASVFRKRLPRAEAPLQPEQQVPENVNQETERGESKGVHSLSMKNNMIQVEDTSASVDQSIMTIKDGFTDLEQILKQKTFTRSEIDRLTTLLRSKAVESSTGKQEQRAQEVNVKSLVSHDRDQGHTHTISMDNGNQNNFVSTPLVSSRVVDECIASPAELAKAYMGSRPSEVSPSMLGLRGQVDREDSVFLTKNPFPSKSPTMSIVPRSSGKNLLPDNGFVTPRSRGRSAVYCMARTPYSRPQSTTKVGLLLPASQNTWEESVPSGSRQGIQTSLKRRSSVLDNDMGSVGPVRRIRQKSNLLSRSLALPASGSQHVSPSYQRGGPNFIHTSRESAVDIPGSSSNPVPSKSSEMASKILQQLDKLVSTREKTPTKLSPSMLRGPALKSLQHVEAPKFLENQEEKLGDLPSSSYQKEDRHKESGSQEGLALSEKPVTAVNTITKTASKKDQDAGVKGTYLPATNSVEEHPPKKRAFRMSAHEDLVELDDDHDAASIPPVEVIEKTDASKLENDTGISKAKGEKPFASSDVKPSAAYVSNGNSSYSTSNGTVETGKSTEIRFAAFGGEAVQQGNVGSDSVSKFTKVAATQLSNSSTAIFSTVDKIDSLKESSKVPPSMPNVFFSPVATNQLDQKSGAASNIKSEKPSSFTFGASEPLAKLPESDKVVSNSASGASSTFSGASTNSGSIFSFGVPTPNNGGPASSPLFTPKISDLSSTSSISQLASAVQSFASTPSTTSLFGNLPATTSKDSNSGSISVSTSVPSFSTAPPFKFGESAASVVTSTVSLSTDKVPKETSVKESAFGNLTSVQSGGTASTVSSTGSAFADQSSAIKSAPSFSFASSSPVVADAGSNIFGGSSAAVGGNTSNTSIAASPATVSGGTTSIFGVTPSPTSATGTGIFSGSSASTTTSSIFGISPALTSSGRIVFGFTAGSGASAVGSQSQTSSLFGAGNSQTGTTSSTPTAPFQFGSSASAPASGNTSTASSSYPFGSSTSGPLLFGTSSTSLLGSSPSLANSASSSSTSTTTSTLFGSNWQPSNSSTSVFGSSFNSSSAPTLSFGGSSGSAIGSTTTTPIFGSSANSSAPSSSSIVSFNSAPAATPSQPVFGGSATGFTFGAATPPTTNGSNNDQMSMEDSMAEDTDQTKASAVPPMFGQPVVVPPSQPTFAFGAGAAATAIPNGGSPFQFGSQQSVGGQQNPSPFQTTSSNIEFSGGGGSFSLGSTGGGDKSGRKFIRVNKNRRQKK